MRHYKSENGATPSLLYFPPKSGETFVVGEAVVLSADYLTKCGATTKPAYIVQGDKPVRGCLPVIAVSSGDTYLAQLSASGTSLKAGQKVTIASDGVDVTATTTDGVAEIIAIHGTAIGDNVEVKF